MIRAGSVPELLLVVAVPEIPDDTSKFSVVSSTRSNERAPCEQHAITSEGNNVYYQDEGGTQLVAT